MYGFNIFFMLLWGWFFSLAIINLWYSIIFHYKQDKIEYYKAQTPIITENCGKINPEDIDEYIEVGGYKSIKKVFETMTPIQVIEEIKKSRLRGRGGAGTPARLLILVERCARIADG